MLNAFRQSVLNASSKRRQRIPESVSKKRFKSVFQQHVSKMLLQKRVWKKRFGNCFKRILKAFLKRVKKRASKKF